MHHLVDLELSLQLATQLAGRSSGAAYPPAQLRGNTREPFRTQDQQAQHKDKQQLRETDVEHRN
jgi:hypothetical protein